MTSQGGGEVDRGKERATQENRKRLSLLVEDPFRTGKRLKN
jgi:hypothetical protein